MRFGLMNPGVFWHPVSLILTQGNRRVSANPLKIKEPQFQKFQQTDKGALVTLRGKPGWREVEVGLGSS